VTAPLVVRLATSRGERVVTRDVADMELRWSIPGGATEATVTLARPLDADPGGIDPSGYLHVSDGRTGQRVFDGPLADPGRGTGLWQIRADGPARHARDRELPVLLLDKSLERWVLRSVGSSRAGEANVTSDDAGNPVVEARVPRGVVAGVEWLVGLENRAAVDTGQKLARVDYRVRSAKTDSNWVAQLVARSGGGASDVARENGFASAIAGSDPRVVGTHWANGRQIAELRIIRKTSSNTVGDDVTYAEFLDVALEYMRVDRHGVEVTSGYDGTLTADQVVEDLLGRVLPRYDGPNAVIEPGVFQLTQLAHPDPVDAARILDELMEVEDRHYWAAWELSTGRRHRFEWRRWPTVPRYEARLGDALDAPGGDVELVNRVTVRWRDVDGRIRSTTRSAAVPVLDDAGLVVQRSLDLGDDVAGAAEAAQVGDVYLAEHSTTGLGGSITVRRTVRDLVTGRLVEPWEIRPGELIRCLGAGSASDPDASVTLPIWHATYRLASNSTELDCQREPRTLSGLLARLARRAETRRRR
jgi:hypothetical protein